MTTVTLGVRPAKPDVRPTYNGRQYILPAIPAGISPVLAEAITRYERGFFGKLDTTDEMDAAAADVAAFQPQSTADLGAKLIITIHYRDPMWADGKLAIDVPEAPIDRKAIEMELDCLDHLLAGISAPQTEDPRLTGAFSTFREAVLELKAQPYELSDNALEQHFYSRMDPADVVMKTTAALTPAGVLMKLKRAFVGIMDEQWSDQAIRDDRPAMFEEGVRMSEMYKEMLWRAVEDLERIAGRAS